MRVDIASDRTYRLGADQQQVWDAISRVDDYRGWWPWLRHFDADRLASGDRWQCIVRPPLPYEIRFVIELVDVVAPERVVAAVSGDIAGSAELTIDATGSGTNVRLVSSLAPQRGTLTIVSALVPWLARSGHDWVLDTGLRQFLRRAL